ncbi:MacS family sensor histidine kinase [Nocardiopsis protaetiae]|uniref:MacS family sensor histidine kinase n=1 Tax=Nocardiopsis protaetiae TaxID=3382270 RepID=UPI00387AC7AC
MWRGISLFRAAALVYSLLLLVQHHEHLTRPWLGWTVLVAMAAWTVVASSAYARPELRTRRLVLADLAVAFTCLFATAVAATPFYLTQAPPLSGYWFAGAALAAGVAWGRRGAGVVAVLYGVADLTLRVIMDAPITPATARGVVLLLLAGLAVGYMARVAGQAEERFARAVALEARLREREQLARSIHDSVLQVLTLVSRRGAEAGGEAAELGRLAGEQEVRLRAMITDGLTDLTEVPADPGAVRAAPAPGPGDLGNPAADTAIDLRDPLRRLESVRVSVSAPATPVPLPGRVAAELLAAVEAALANVELHCPPGTRAWILVEDEEDAVTVTVRDEGPGIPPGRLEEAGRQGRLGVAQSVRGRLRDLGGTVEVFSAPGQGTEVEMRLPR